MYRIAYKDRVTFATLPNVLLHLAKLVPEPPGRDLLDYLAEMSPGEAWESRGVTIEKVPPHLTGVEHKSDFGGAA